MFTPPIVYVSVEDVVEVEARTDGGGGGILFASSSSFRFLLGDPGLSVSCSSSVHFRLPFGSAFTRIGEGGEDLLGG